MAKKRKKKIVKKRKKTAKRKKPAKRKKKKTTKKKAVKKAKKKTKKGKRGKRYTAKQRANLLKKYHELRKAGTSADKAAKKVGVSYLTLLKWEKKSGKRIKTKRGRPKGKKGISKKTALKKALKVPRGRPLSKKRSRASKPAGGLTLVTPSGFRIEGITTKELIKVLRGMK